PEFKAWIRKRYLHTRCMAFFNRFGHLRVLITIKDCPNLIAFFEGGPPSSAAPHSCCALASFFGNRHRNARRVNYLQVYQRTQKVATNSLEILRLGVFPLAIDNELLFGCAFGSGASEGSALPHCRASNSVTR